jgi:glycosyltransferase involved in cell wall biosynthesis
VNKKVSIITITYNNYQGLEKTFQSVINQTAIESIEYIIIDGFSSDGTVEFLKDNTKNVHYWVSEKDRGISHAFNKGLAQASGDYVLMLNAGDVFSDKYVIENFWEDISKNSVDILAYKVHVLDELYNPRTDSTIRIWNNCDMPHQGTFVSKKIYELVGEYSEEYRIRMDFHFFARCHAMGAIFHYIPKVIVEYEPGGTSMKKENRMTFWKEGMAVKMLYNINYTLKDLLKMILWRL